MYNKLRAAPEIWDEGKILPPILVSGEIVSEDELLLFPSSPDIGKASRFSTVVRWYSGVHMYRVLKHVSRRGIDDVKRLLIAAGNDKDSLDMIFSVSKLLAISSL
jgi:hypothetical protein